MGPSLALPLVPDSASLTGCLVNLVWRRPFGAVETTVFFQVLDGAVGLQRPAHVLLTVVANVVRHRAREAVQILVPRPVTDAFSLSLLERNQLLRLLCFGIPLLFCLVCLEIFCLAVLDQRVKAVPRLLETAVPDDVARAVLWARAVEQHLVLFRLAPHPDDWNT